MTPYAADTDLEEYGCNLEWENAEKWLARASRNIDTLTFNRIPARGGFDHLTEYQKDVIREVCCRLAEFERDNEDFIQSFVSSYSINGVSAQFGNGWNLRIESGVAIPAELYHLLQQTGLCVRTVNY
ncbi:MAG: hypothetical protein ACI4PQ_00665 [Butyricicoccaceae bacterium]